MQTIRFLPDRLNVEPVVFRGFTTSEMGLAALAGVGIGLLVSIPLSLLVGWMMIPTGMLVTPLIIIWFSGKILVRLKRGKPENYIWQRLEIRKYQLGLSRQPFFLLSQGWSLKRSRTTRSNK